MDAVAYPDPTVADFIAQNFIPLRLMADDKVFAVRYRIKWTPSLLVLDSLGVEHYRTLGFYPPAELIPSLLMGMAKVYFDKPDRPKAIELFERLLREFPKNSLAPEAVYLMGVSRYIETHHLVHLTDIYDRMLAEYPDSPWVTRSSPYSLLKK
jgi:tetratricopeptide (TPR) repeat protein